MDALKQACNLLPPNYVMTCTNYIVSNIEELTNAIQGSLGDTSLACINLNACP